MIAGAFAILMAAMWVTYLIYRSMKRTAFEVVAEGVHFASTAREAPKVDIQRTPEPFKTNAVAADVKQDGFAVIDDSEDLPF